MPVARATEEGQRKPPDWRDLEPLDRRAFAKPAGERLGERQEEHAPAGAGQAERGLAREQRLAAARGSLDQQSIVVLEGVEECELPPVEHHPILGAVAGALAERQPRLPRLAPQLVEPSHPVAALRAGRRQRVLDEARERLVEPAEVLLTESRPRKVVLRRRRAECHVGKAGGHTVRGRLALTVRQACEQQRPEAKRLLARRGLHQLRVLPPESVTQLDSAALHLEHQQAAPGLGDDEVALPAPSLARLDAERVPGVPARRQLRAERLVDAHLRARAGRPRVLARIDARGGKHLWSLAGPGRFYIGPIWRVLEVSLHLLDLCEELPSRVASACPGSAQSWAWALNVATSASNPTASQGRPALQVTGEHREEPLEPPAPRGHAARADSARFATFAGSGPSTRSHRSRRGSVGATACRQHGS